MDCGRAIRDGVVVTAASCSPADIRIRDGVITQIGGVTRGWRELDAAGRYAFPAGRISPST